MNKLIASFAAFWMVLQPALAVPQIHVPTPQPPPAPAPKPAPQPMPAPSPKSSTAPTSKSSSSKKEPTVFKEDELASLLAPIALYPDKVIGTILVASTYPLEVVQAQRWIEANSKLKPEQVAKDVQKQTWDPSVKELCGIPEVLKKMDEKLDWTQKVGDAVLAQQKDVLNAIQKLRKQAKDSGNLKTDEHLKVTTQPASETAPATPATGTAAAASSSTQVIVIESANPDVIYVPTYTTAVYGTWAYPSYPPYYWPPPYGYPGYGFWYGMAGMAITVGFWSGAWGAYGCGRGGGTINNIYVGGGVGGVGGDGGVGGVGVGVGDG